MHMKDMVISRFRLRLVAEERRTEQTKIPPELAIAEVLKLLPGCPLRAGSVFMYASVSPSRTSGCLLRSRVSADLSFPQSPSARSA
jgi:hypothetical protein